MNFVYYGIDVGDITETDFMEALGKVDKDFTDCNGKSLDFDATFCDLMIWNNQNYDMLEVSKLFLNNLFTVYGKSETPDEIWKAYYFNGETAKCNGKLIFDEGKTIWLMEKYWASREE